MGEAVCAGAVRNAFVPCQVRDVTPIRMMSA